MRTPARDSTSIARRRTLTSAVVALIAVIPGPAAGQDPAAPPPPPPLEQNEALQEILEELDPGLREQLAKVLGQDAPLMLDDAMGDQFAAAEMFGNSIGARFLNLSSGAVKADVDTADLLERAEAFAQRDRFDLASRLWQQAIDQSSDALIHREDWQEQTFHGNVYRRLMPLISEIEASMSRAIRDSLAAYQLKIDGDARALLARSNRATRESALAEVVLRYFLSSIGDDAAFELGCLQMERGEFLPARRLFTKILDEYPEPSVERSEVEIRLAGSLARTGEISRALEIVDNLSQELPERGRVLELVRKDIEQVRQDWHGGTPATAVLSTPATVQPSLTGRLPKTLRTVWTQPFELILPPDWPVLPESTRSALPEVTDPYQNARNRAQQPPSRPPALETRWREMFMPVGQMLVRGQRAYFKTDDRVVACDTATGQLQWLGWRHNLILDENTRMASRRRHGTSALEQREYPMTPEEFLLFGDQVHQSMTLTQDTLYVLEGDLLDVTQNRAEISPANEPRRFGLRVNTPGRFRENRLVAYEADTGKLKWDRRAGEAPSAEAPILARAGFSGTPLPYGSLLLVPVHEESSLWLTGLDQQTGETRWRTFLCDEPGGECEGLSAIALTVNAGDAYVGSGAGLIFSVNAVSGKLNWALEYPRRAELPNSDGRSVLVPRYDNLNRFLDGWSRDRLLARGNEIIVAGTDFNQLFAVQRQTGKLAWETPQKPFRSPRASDYVIAAHEDRVYVGGRQAVRCYFSHGGRMDWETILPTPSHARAAFTPDGLFVPLADSVVQLDPATGEIVAQARVIGPANDSEPVGNLFTDGERLLVYGLKRIYALAPGSESESSEELTP